MQMQTVYKKLSGSGIHAWVALHSFTSYEIIFLLELPNKVKLKYERGTHQATASRLLMHPLYKIIKPLEWQESLEEAALRNRLPAITSLIEKPSTLR